jgi:hypothetical protein
MTADNSKLICRCQLHTGYVRTDSLVLRMFVPSPRLVGSVAARGLGELMPSFLPRRSELDAVDPRCHTTANPFGLRFDLQASPPG